MGNKASSPTRIADRNSRRAGSTRAPSEEQSSSTANRSSSSSSSRVGSRSSGNSTATTISTGTSTSNNSGSGRPSRSSGSPSRAARTSANNDTRSSGGRNSGGNDRRETVSGREEHAYYDDDDELYPYGEEAERPQQEMSWYQMAKAGYQELVNAIIRPPRAKYEVEHLGPTEFEYLGKAFKRVDFRLLNERGHVLECSHWQPKGWRRAEQLPCIVYMHGNSSARVEALPQVSLALCLGATLVAFDFAGSGRSGGDYVSLGYYERDDLKAVIEHLRRSGEVGAIALWGRSMGAATALLHGDRDMTIAALVLDSAFADLTQLAEEMVERGRQAGLAVPGFVVKMALRMIRGTVAKTANFNVRDLCPINHADRTFIPALFIAGRGDDFIRPHHSQQIHDRYAGDKNLVLVEGDHNSPRPSFLFDSVCIFLQNYLQVPLEWGLDRRDTIMGFPPWHPASGGMGDAGGMLGAAGGVESSRGRGRDQHGVNIGVDGDLTDFVDWDGIGLNEISVDGGGAPDGEAMTAADTQSYFQTALFHMLAQERTDSTPAAAAPAAATADNDGRPGERRNDEGVNGVAASAGKGDRTDAAKAKPVSSATPTPLEQTLKGGVVHGGKDERMSNGAGGPAVGGRVQGTREQMETEAAVAAAAADAAESAAAVAAVAAALRAPRNALPSSSTPSSLTTSAAASAARRNPKSGEFGTSETSGFGLGQTFSSGFVAPGAIARPTMAPFSVSDTSDFEEPTSPDRGFQRRTRGRGGGSGSGGGGRFSGGEPVAEGQEGEEEFDEDGGVEGVAEVCGSANDTADIAAAAVGVKGVVDVVEEGLEEGEEGDRTGRWSTALECESRGRSGVEGANADVDLDANVDVDVDAKVVSAVRSKAPKEEEEEEENPFDVKCASSKEAQPTGGATVEGGAVGGAGVVCGTPGIVHSAKVLKKSGQEEARGKGAGTEFDDLSVDDAIDGGKKGVICQTFGEDRSEKDSITGATPSPPGLGSTEPTNLAGGDGGEEWSCLMCTLINSAVESECQACGTPRAVA